MDFPPDNGQIVEIGYNGTSISWIIDVVVLSSIWLRMMLDIPGDISTTLSLA